MKNSIQKLILICLILMTNGSCSRDPSSRLKKSTVPEQDNSSLALINSLELANVKDPIYGATGDGQTDDTNAIQKAIDSGRRNIIFPAGRYNISRPLILKSDLNLKRASVDKVTIVQTYVLPVASPLPNTSTSSETEDILTKASPLWDFFVMGDCHPVNFMGENYGPSGERLPDGPNFFGKIPVIGDVWPKDQNYLDLSSSDAANLSVGEIVIVRATKKYGRDNRAGLPTWQQPDHVQFVKIASIVPIESTNPPVKSRVTFEDKDKALSAIQKPYLHKIQGVDLYLSKKLNLTGSNRINFHVVENINIDGLDFEGGRVLFSKKCSYNVRLRNSIMTNIHQPLSINACTHCSFENITSTFRDRAIEIKMASTDVLIKNVQLRWLTHDNNLPVTESDPWKRPAISVGERSQNITLSGISIRFPEGYLGTAPMIRLNGSSGVVFRNIDAKLFDNHNSEIIQIVGNPEDENSDFQFRDYRFVGSNLDVRNPRKSLFTINGSQDNPISEVLFARNVWRGTRTQGGNIGLVEFARNWKIVQEVILNASSLVLSSHAEAPLPKTISHVAPNTLPNP